MADQINYAEFYERIKPSLKKDSVHDLIIAVILASFIGWFAWNSKHSDEAITILVIGFVLVTVFLIRAHKAKNNPPLVYKAILKSKRMVEYKRNKNVGNSEPLKSYDYFVDLEVSFGASFNQNGIIKKENLPFLTFQIWDQQVFDKIAEQDDLFVFTSNTGILVGFIKNDELIKVEAF